MSELKLFYEKQQDKIKSEYDGLIIIKEKKISEYLDEIVNYKSILKINKEDILKCKSSLQNIDKIKEKNMLMLKNKDIQISDLNKQYKQELNEQKVNYDKQISDVKLQYTNDQKNDQDNQDKLINEKIEIITKLKEDNNTLLIDIKNLNVEINKLNQSNKTKITNLKMEQSKKIEELNQS